MMTWIRTTQKLLQASLLEKTKITQKIIFFGGFGIITSLVVIGLVLKSHASSKENHAKKDEEPKKEKRIKIDSGGSVLSAQEVWVDRLEKEQALLNKRFESMEKILTELAKDKLASGKNASFQTGQTEQNRMFPPEYSETEFTSRPNVLDSRGLQSTSLPVQGLGGAPIISQTSMPQSNSKETASTEPLKLQRVTFNMDPMSSKKIKKSIDHYVPAGSFVRGRLTSGVVAATSVQASSNPQPIHIELTNLGNLPRDFKTDVKQCFLIGSAYGDLSSERVLMRLETLSCVERKTQEIIELNVDGFVTGEDGANGLRGIVVDRTGPAMRSAFVGGFLSGIGNFFGQQQTSVPTMISPGGVASVNPLSAQHMLQGGAGKGVGNAMEKLSEFYIKRAEQLQPVLEVEPGRLVHVVFKKGFDMNQTVYRQSLMNVRDGGRRDVASNAGSETNNEPHL